MVSSSRGATRKYSRPLCFPSRTLNRCLRRRYNRVLNLRRNPGSDAADGACNGAYCPPESFCRTAPGVSGMETLSGGGKMNRMSEAIA